MRDRGGGDGDILCAVPDAVQICVGVVPTLVNYPNQGQGVLRAVLAKQGKRKIKDESRLDHKLWRVRTCQYSMRH